MSNAQINATFLKTIASADRDYVLSNIAKHYGCTRLDALAEVLDDDAEHLLDYMVGPARWLDTETDARNAIIAIKSLT